jgi:uncharacterized protein
MDTTRRLHQVDDAERARIVQCVASELAADPAVLFGYLFGSFVESQRFHDIDVGVYLEVVQAATATPTALAMAQRLSERVGKTVDVRILNVAPMSFLYHVLRGRLIFCRDAAVLGEVIEHTISRYLDIAPLLRQATREAFAA